MADERHCKARATLAPFNFDWTAMEAFGNRVAVRTFCLAVRFMTVTYQPFGPDM